MIAEFTGGWLKLCFALLAALACFPAPAWAQRKKADKDKAEDPPAVEMVTYENPRVIEANIGLKLTTRSGQLGEVISTTAFPAEWPEQKVENLESTSRPVSDKPSATCRAAIDSWSSWPQDSCSDRTGSDC